MSSPKGTPIVLSLKDERFKSIAYRHFRLLGTRRDKEAEREAHRCVYDELTCGEEYGDAGPQFCKLKEDRMIFVTKEKAREFIQETFKRRLRTTHLWLEKSTPPHPEEGEMNQPLSNDEREGGTSFSSDQSEDDETLASVAAQKAAAAPSKRKSPRLIEESTKKPVMTASAGQSTVKESKKQSPDIFLSMADPYYKQTIFHYFELRKKGQTTTVQATKEIFAKFQNYLNKSGGGYYKTEHKSREQYSVDNNDVVIRKIKTDLNKINRYENEMASTIVLDVERDTKFSSVIYKKYDSIGSNATDKQKRDAARQILDDLKQNYSYFVRIVNGDRLEISDEEDLILDIILENIQRRQRRTKNKIQSSSKKSVLDDRLTNRKHMTITSRTPIETVSQLIQILQLVTHKLNDIHGTHRCHGKVLRLYQLPELGGDAVNAPKLSEIAKQCGVSQSNIRKYFDMCQNAERRGFDLRLLGNDSIEQHSGIFEEGESDIFVLEHSGEKAMGELFSQAARKHLDELAFYGKKTVRSSLDEVKESDDENNDKMEVEAAATTDVIEESNEKHGHLNEMSRDHTSPIFPGARLDSTSKETSEKIDSIQTSAESHQNIPNIVGLDTKLDIEKKELSVLEEPAANITDQSSPAHSQEQEDEHIDVIMPAPSNNDKLVDPISNEDKQGVHRLHSKLQPHVKSTETVDRSIEKAEQIDEMQIDTSEPATGKYDIPIEDVMLLQDEPRPDKTEDNNPNSTAKEEANDSYNHMKSSIAQISDAIGPKHVVEKSITAKFCDAAEGLDLNDPIEGLDLNDPISEPAAISENRPADANKQNLEKLHAFESTPMKESMPSCTNPEQEAQIDRPNSLLGDVQIGSRINVKWGKNGSLWKATVKKISTNKAKPSIKVHYDGKKSHILDQISLDMIESLIPDQEGDCVDDSMSSVHVNNTSETDQSNVALNDLLRGKYPNSLPNGKLEHREQCLELGPGWTVYITAKRNQGGQKHLRTNRYFIAPSGKSFRNTDELEKYRIERPDEFDICRIEDDPDDVVTDELIALPTTTRQETDGLKNSLPQCQGISNQSPAVAPNTESETHHFTHDSFSPLMMGQSTQPIEDSHSDREFLSSLMDEKGLLFGDDDDEDNDLEDDLSSFPVKGCPETIQACALKPMASCIKCPSPRPKGEAGEDNVKKIVHFAEESESNQNESTPQYKEKKKVLSPRMKHNKKSLIGGVVPVFALDIPAGAEFAGYLGDAPTDNDSDSESNEEESGPTPAAGAQYSRVTERSSLSTVAPTPSSPKISPSSTSKEQSSNSSSFVRISPISLRYTDEAVTKNETLRSTVSRPQPKKPDDAASRKPTTPRSQMKSSNSPNEVAAINTKPTHSAFVAVSRTKQQGSAPSTALPSSSPLKKASSELKKTGSTQLFAFEYSSGQGDEASTRPKRKLKATVRYDPDMIDSQKNGCKTGSGFLCPRCDFICEYSSKVCSGCQLECYYEAGVGVVSLKERESVSSCQTIVPSSKKPKSSHVSRQEGVLCNCTYCDRHHFSIQGIYAHHGRVHGDSEGTKLDWSKVTFSCPFCKSSEKKMTLSQVEKHVRDHHPGCELLTPKYTERPSKNRSRHKGASPPPPSPLNVSLRVTRVKQPGVSSESFSAIEPFPETFSNWSKLDHRSLLPDCKKDYPREIPNILDLVEEQCKAQEEVVATAREQRFKLCKTEAELEAKALDDDRLAYQRGIRERARLADAERIEKQRFTESQKLIAMQYEYENRNRKRTKDEVEAEKLCSKPIVFFSTTGRHLPNEKNVCKTASCELCKKDSFYLHCIMLDTEVATMNMNDPSSQSLPPKANVLMPSIAKIGKDYLSQAEEHFEDEEEGGTKAKLSRRDVATSKRLRVEEDKLFKLRSNQRNLEFIDRYNAGALRNTWKTSR